MSEITIQQMIDYYKSQSEEYRLRAEDLEIQRELAQRNESFAQSKKPSGPPPLPPRIPVGQPVPVMTPDNTVSAILDLLRQKRQRPRSLANSLNLNEGLIRGILDKMKQDGQIHELGQGWLELVN